MNALYYVTEICFVLRVHSRTLSAEMNQMILIDTHSPHMVFGGRELPLAE